jgi:hypothetical protein
MLENVSLYEYEQAVSTQLLPPTYWRNAFSVSAHIRSCFLFNSDAAERGLLTVRCIMKLRLHIMGLSEGTICGRCEQVQDFSTVYSVSAGRWLGVG